MIDVGKGFVDFSLLPSNRDGRAFKHVPASQWCNGTVVMVQHEGIVVVVSSPSSGLEAAGVVGLSDIVNRASVKVGQAVQVRVIDFHTGPSRSQRSGPSRSQRSGPMKLSMLPRPAEGTWLEGIVQEVTDLGLHVLVGDSRGFVLAPQVREGFVEDVRQEGFEPGQAVRVRVVGSAGTRGLQLSMLELS